MRLSEDLFQVRFNGSKDIEGVQVNSCLRMVSTSKDDIQVVNQYVDSYNIDLALEVDLEDRCLIYATEKPISSIKGEGDISSHFSPNKAEFPTESIRVARLDHDSNQEENEKEFSSCISSNILFFLGSMFYFIVDVIDLYKMIVYPGGSKEVDDDALVIYQDDELPSLPLYVVNYKINLSTLFYVLATLFYLLNACYDFSWARRRVKEETLEENSRTSYQNTLISSFGKAVYLQLRPEVAPDVDDAKIAIHQSKLQNFTCRKHSRKEIQQFRIFPRRETALNIRVAMIFGLAAIIDFLGAVLSEFRPVLAQTLYAVACNGYALEALIAVLGRKKLHILEDRLDSLEEGGILQKSVLSMSKENLCSDSEDLLEAKAKSVEFMLRLGDSLFLTGSLMDLVMSYFCVFPRIERTPIFIELSCLSSTLWLLDSIIYFVAAVS